MTTDKTELNGRSPTGLSVESVVVRCPKSRNANGWFFFRGLHGFFASFVIQDFPHADARISNWHAHARHGIMSAQIGEAQNGSNDVQGSRREDGSRTDW